MCDRKELKNSINFFVWWAAVYVSRLNESRYIHIYVGAKIFAYTKDDDEKKA